MRVLVPLVGVHTSARSISVLIVMEILSSIPFVSMTKGQLLLFCHREIVLLVRLFWLMLGMLTARLPLMRVQFPLVGVHTSSRSISVLIVMEILSSIPFVSMTKGKLLLFCHREIVLLVRLVRLVLGKLTALLPLPVLLVALTPIEVLLRVACGLLLFAQPVLLVALTPIEVLTVA